jgi:hypothetical protein
MFTCKSRPENGLQALPLRPCGEREKRFRAAFARRSDGHKRRAAHALSHVKFFFVLGRLARELVTHKIQ